MFLTAIAESLRLPDTVHVRKGLHNATGYKDNSATLPNVAGMAADCTNININRKLAIDFRADDFGLGIFGFFDSCKAWDKPALGNLYQFTLASANKPQLDEVCRRKEALPAVYDSQHGTYWVDFPFSCSP